MRIFHNFSKRKPGSTPGALVYVGEKKVADTRIQVLDYDKGSLREYPVDKIQAAFGIKDSPTVSWLNIDGLHDVALMEAVGEHFQIHPLVMEDIINTHQHPKCEDHGDYLFVVLKMMTYDETNGGLHMEQVSLILFANCVLTFQELYSDTFAPIQERIRNSKGKMREKAADYLFYALMDAIVDHYYLILDRVERKIELLEEAVIKKPTSKTLQKIHNLKNDIVHLRRSTWPLRDIINELIQSETKLIKKSTGIYLKDLYDHAMQVASSIDIFRDMLSSLMDLHLSNVNNKMNEVMKVLTIFAAIFIPLTFAVGIYGMNFEYMPELKWHFAYPTLLGIMGSIGVGMVFFFKKKKWL